MKMKKLLTLCGGILLILVLAALPFMGACAPAPPAPPVEPIKIGAILPLTGGLSHYGAYMKAAAELALDEAGWEVAGRPIQLLIEDDASFDEVQALLKMRKLVEVDKVDFLMGPAASSSFLGTETYIDVMGIPCFALGYRGELVEWEPGELGWDLATAGSLAQWTYPLGQWVYEQGFRTAVTMAPDYETGYQGVGGFTDAFTKAGGTVIQHQWSPVGHTDYGPYLAAMKEADVTLMFQYGAGVISYVKQYHEFGFWDKQPLILLATDSLLGPSLAELGDFTIGLKAGIDYTWTIDTPANNKFVAAFEAKTGMKPEPPAAWTYSSILMLLGALEATGGDTTPEVLRDALLGLTVETPSGPMTFDALKGYSIEDVFVTEVQLVDGQLAYKVLKTFPAAINPGYYTKP